MTCDAHDRYAANTQFISHFMARVLYEYKIEETPIDTKNVARLRELSTQITEDHSFDLFSGLYRFNKYSPSQIIRLRCALDSIEDNLKNHSTIHKL